MIMQEAMILQVCITNGTSTAVSSSGIQFSNNDESGILQGNQEWVIKLLEIVESSPVHNTLHQEKGRDNSPQPQWRAARESPDTRGVCN